jgi:DNA-binding NarL/FixJ family response regulator
MTAMPVSVLVVDDDRAFRALAMRILEAMQFTVVGQAETCASGASAAAELQPDAALVDVWLPDGNGLQLVQLLAALPSPPRVVLTSSDPDASSDAAARRAGAIGFIPKSELTNDSLRRMLVGE